MKGLLLPACLVLLTACGSGGGGISDALKQGNQGNQGGGVSQGGSGSNPAPTPAPTLSLTASPTSVSSGSTSTVSWSASNASSCTASGAWSGSKGTSGSFKTASLNSDATYTLNCNGSGGGVVARVTVKVTANNPSSPTVQLTASPAGVAANGSTTLTWNTSNVTSCTASGGWSGSKAASGSASVGPLNQDQTFQLSCSGAGGNAVAMTTVTIRRAVLSWTAPTKNVDGSALTDLAGYKLYWGTKSRSYGTPAVINGANSTTYTLDNLAPGTYYFALTAVDASGTESAKTNEVSKTIY